MLTLPDYQRVLHRLEAAQEGEFSMSFQEYLLIGCLQTLESEKMNDYKFTIAPRYYPSVITCSDRQPRLTCIMVTAT